MKYKLIFLLSSAIYCFSSQSIPLIISTKSINYKELVSSKYKVLLNTEANRKFYKVRCKEFIAPEELKNNEYRAKHYIRKNKVICKKDIFIHISKKIKFNFGFLEIEKDGEVVRETEQYIKIRNYDGSTQKFYKGIQ